MPLNERDRSKLRKIKADLADIRIVNALGSKLSDKLCWSHEKAHGLDDKVDALQDLLDKYAMAEDDLGEITGALLELGLHDAAQKLTGSPDSGIETAEKEIDYYAESGTNGQNTATDKKMAAMENIAQKLNISEDTELKEIEDACRQLKFGQASIVGDLDHRRDKLPFLVTEVPEKSGRLKQKFYSIFGEIQEFLQTKCKELLPQLWVPPPINYRGWKDASPKGYLEFLSQALKDNNLLLCMGEAGHGKTTLSLRLAYDWAKGQLPQFDLLIVAVNISTVPKPANSIMELVLKYMLNQKYLSEHHASFLLALSYQLTAKPKTNPEVHVVDPDGKLRVLIVIDGYEGSICSELDEALNSRDSIAFDFSILVTAQPHTVAGRIRCPAAVCCLLPWRPEDVQKFMTLYFGENEPHNFDFVQDFIYSRPELKEFTSTPLLLSHICLMGKDGLLDSSKCCIYRSFLQLLVKDQAIIRDAFHGDFGCISSCAEVYPLAKGAFDSLIGDNEPKTAINSKDMEKEAIDYRLFLKLGILQLHDNRPTQFEFGARYVHEYLAAELLYSSLTEIDQLSITIKDGEAILLEEESRLLSDVMKVPFERAAEVFELVAGMALNAKEDRNRIINNVAVATIAWNSRHSQASFGENLLFLALLMQLSLACESRSKGLILSLVRWFVFQCNHCIDNLLSIVFHFNTIRLAENVHYLQEIDALIISPSIADNNDSVELENRKIINLCLMEHSDLGILQRLCRKNRWKSVLSLHLKIVDFVPESLSIDTNISGPLIEIRDAKLNFSASSTPICVQPYLRYISSWATVSNLTLTNATIEDLDMLLEVTEIRQNLTRLTLENISIRTVSSFTAFCKNVRKLQQLDAFEINSCDISGKRLIDLMTKLKNCSSLRYLSINRMGCLAEPNIFQCLCRLLSKWYQLNRVSFHSNSFSQRQVDHLMIAADSILKSGTELVLLERGINHNLPSASAKPVWVKEAEAAWKEPLSASQIKAWSPKRPSPVMKASRVFEFDRERDTQIQRSTSFLALRYETYTQTEGPTTTTIDTPSSPPPGMEEFIQWREVYVKYVSALPLIIIGCLLLLLTGLYWMQYMVFTSPLPTDSIIMVMALLSGFWIVIARFHVKFLPRSMFARDLCWKCGRTQRSDCHSGLCLSNVDYSVDNNVPGLEDDQLKTLVAQSIKNNDSYSKATEFVHSKLSLSGSRNTNWVWECYAYNRNQGDSHHGKKSGYAKIIIGSHIFTISRSIDDSSSIQSTILTPSDSGASLKELTNEILIIGGSDINAMRSMECYSLFTNTSHQLEISLGHDRVGHVTGVLVDGRVMVACGTGQYFTEIIDLNQREILPGPPISLNRTNAASAMLNGDFYVSGGEDSVSNPLSSCEVFRDGKWMSIPDMNMPRSGHALLAVGPYLYAICGIGKNGEILRSVERFCPQRENWQIVENTNYKRYGLSAEEINGLIYACGGCDENGENSLCESYDPRTNRWRIVANMNVARNGFCLVSVGGRLVALGGECDSANQSVESYGPNDNNWVMEGQLKTPRFCSSAVKCI